MVKPRPDHSGDDLFTSKPFQSTISHWKRVYFKKEDYPDFPDNLGYVIQGVPHGHPEFSDWIRTSAVVKHNEETGEIETLNSLYKLID